MSLEERFWAKVDRRGEDECWPWVGAMFSSGYGVLRNGRGGNISAHRVSWEIANGRTIPDGLCCCHRCDNPVCVNPAHLFLGDHAANNQDCRDKGRNAVGLRNGSHTHPERRARGESNGRAKLSWAQAQEIRSLYATGKITKTDLGKMFGVSDTQIRRIVNGMRWLLAPPAAPDCNPITTKET